MSIHALIRRLSAASVFLAMAAVISTASLAQETAPKAAAPNAAASKDSAPKGADPKAADPKATDSKATDPKATGPKATGPKTGAPASKADAPASKAARPAGQPAAPDAQADAERPRLSRTMASIEPLKEAIDQIETSLRSPDIGDATLVQHRGRLEPVRDELREIITSLDARLVDVEARLKQLGDAPEDGEPKEDPALTEERARLEERRAALDGALKQTRLLMLRADNISVRITERRRGLFTQQLLGRSLSVLDPALWTQAFKAAPDAWFGVKLLAQGWMDHFRASATSWNLGAAGIALSAFFIGAALFLRWFVRRDFRPKELGTRFAKSFFALLSLLRVTITAPAIVVGALLILNGFGLLTERIGNIGLTLAIAVTIAAFGRGVAVGLFAPGDPDRRLLSVREETAGLVASKLIWVARILGAVILVNAILQIIVAPVILTVATNAIFAAVIAALLCRFLFLMGNRETLEDDVAGAGWLRSAGWLLAIGIVAALVTGFIGLAAFLAGRFLSALGLIGALYILLDIHRRAVHRSADGVNAARPLGRAFFRNEAAFDRSGRNAAVGGDPDIAGAGRVDAAAGSVGDFRSRLLRRGEGRHVRIPHRRNLDIADHDPDRVRDSGDRYPGDSRRTGLAQHPFPAAHYARSEPAEFGFDHFRLSRRDRCQFVRARATGRRFSEDHAWSPARSRSVSALACNRWSRISYPG